MNASRWLGRLRRIFNGFGATRGKLVSAPSKAAYSARSPTPARAHRTPPKGAKPSTVAADKMLTPAVRVAATATVTASATAAVTVVTLTEPVSAVVAQPAQKVKAAVVASPVTVAMAHETSQPQRTLVEVRNDLARLRERSRQRQAKAERARDTSFAPTDFMELLEHALPATVSKPALAPTAYLDFGAARARQGR